MVLPFSATIAWKWKKLEWERKHANESIPMPHAVFGIIWQNCVFTSPLPPECPCPHLGEILDPPLVSKYIILGVLKQKVCKENISAEQEDTGPVKFSICFELLVVSAEVFKEKDRSLILFAKDVFGRGRDLDFKVAVHTCDVLWHKNLNTTHSQASLNTSCIVHLFYPIELWSIAIPCGGQ